jgi:hypothetical protein
LESRRKKTGAHDVWAGLGIFFLVILYQERVAFLKSDDSLRLVKTATHLAIRGDFWWGRRPRLKCGPAESKAVNEVRNNPPGLIAALS